MELSSAIVGMREAELLGKVQLAVARKILDNQKMQGEAAVQLIEAAAQAGAQAGDSLVAAATGLGAHLDTYG